MFENIVIRRLGEGEGALDPGLIAEVLLFYQSAHLVLEQSSLTHLLRIIGPGPLIRLMKDHGTKVTYFQDSIGTQTDTNSGLPVHKLIAYSLAGHKNTKALKRKSEFIEFIFERALGKSRETKRSARIFRENAEFLSMATGFGHDKGLIGTVRDDLDDSNFLKDAARIAIRKYVPDYEFPKGWRFRVVDWTDGFLVDSTLDYDEITQAFHGLEPETDIQITSAQILSDISEGSTDLRLSAHYGSEYATQQTPSLIAQARLQGIVNACTNQTEEIRLFQDIVLDDTASIRESINSGERSFDDFLDLLEKSDKFKKWVGNINQDKGLLQQYVKEINSGSWLDKLAPKSIKFAFASGVGALADLVVPGGGLALSATENFLLDKMLRGWKPSHFVSGPLRNFTKG